MSTETDKFITDHKEIGMMFKHVQELVKAIKTQNTMREHLLKTATRVRGELAKCSAITHEQSLIITDLDKQCNKLRQEHK